MATYASIRFDFEKSKREAAKLEEAAAQLKKLANNTMDSSLNQLASGWKGESAAAYIGKARIVEKNILTTANDLFAVAASIRKTAQKIYNAEMEAKRLAEEKARKK